MPKVKARKSVKRLVGAKRPVVRKAAVKTAGRKAMKPMTYQQEVAAASRGKRKTR